MTDEQPTIDEPPAERWPEEAEELSPRARRRVLTPLPLALLGALAIACGFIAGVFVEKDQSGSATDAGASGGLASRLGALRSGSSSGSGSGSGSGSSSSGSGAGSGTPAGLAGTPGSGSGGIGSGSTTVGQVAYASKGTLYVTTSEGNTVKVTAARGASVTKTLKASIKAIHPGETVLVAGASRANGAISASSIRIGSVAGGLTGGGVFAGATGASGGGGASSSSSSGAAASGSGEPQLFGKG